LEKENGEKLGFGDGKSLVFIRGYLLIMNDAQEMLAKMTTEALNKLILQLGRYVAKKSKRYYWRTDNSIELPQGETFDSIVSKAFVSILEDDDESRHWIPEKHPNFAKYMMGVIDSILYHLAKSSDNKFFKRIPEKKEIGDVKISSVTNSKGAKVNGAEWLLMKNLTPEELLLQEEEISQAENLLYCLKDKIKDDTELKLIVAAIEKGCKKSSDKEIVKFTGISIKQVQVAKKRLERRIDSVNAEFINSHSKN